MAVLRTLLAFALLALASTAAAQETVPDLSAILENIDISAILANLPGNSDSDIDTSLAIKCATAGLDIVGAAEYYQTWSKCAAELTGSQDPCAYVVTDECKGAIEASRKMFEGLPEECKTLVGSFEDESDLSVDCSPGSPTSPSSPEVSPSPESPSTPTTSPSPETPSTPTTSPTSSPNPSPSPSVSPPPGSALAIKASFLALATAALAMLL